jgi:hypothetical protein
VQLTSQINLAGDRRHGKLHETDFESEERVVYGRSMPKGDSGNAQRCWGATAPRGGRRR